MGDHEPRESMRDLMLVADPDFEDVLRCVFGLREHEVSTYRVLRRAQPTTVADIADRADRDRSNVSRSLSSLREKGLAERRRELVDGGGHRYCYVAPPPEEVRERMHESLEAWASFVHDRIDSFGTDDF